MNALEAAKSWAESAASCATEDDNMAAAVESSLALAWAAISIAESLQAGAVSGERADQ